MEKSQKVRSIFILDRVGHFGNGKRGDSWHADRFAFQRREKNPCAKMICMALKSGSRAFPKNLAREKLVFKVAFF